MKAISVLQPWASALLGAKDIENRSWPLPEKYFDVPLALHAGKRRSWPEESAFIEMCVEHPEWMLNFRALPYGAVIGVIVFSSNVTASNSPWFAGPYGWVRLDVRALATPIPCRGALGIWTAPAEVEEEVRRQLRDAVRDIFDDHPAIQAAWSRLVNNARGQGMEMPASFDEFNKSITRQMAEAVGIPTELLAQPAIKESDA